MTNFNIALPASSAPVNRLSLGVGSVRAGMAGIGSGVNPSFCRSNEELAGGCICFEGNEE
jgi:hypothetical protein